MYPPSSRRSSSVRLPVNRSPAGTDRTVFRLTPSPWALPPEEAVHRALDETREALQWLVKQGGLLETSTKNGGGVCRLNAQKKPCAPFHAAQDRDMPSITIDAMNNAALWTALAPDGITPSAELSLALDSSRSSPPGATT